MCVSVVIFGSLRYAHPSQGAGGVLKADSDISEASGRTAVPFFSRFTERPSRSNSRRFPSFTSLVKQGLVQLSCNKPIVISSLSLYLQVQTILLVDKIHIKTTKEMT